jgi:uncharacterized Rossmann fold enzyme
MNIKWFDRITNEDLWSITQQKAIENQIKIRKLNWIAHIMQRSMGNRENCIRLESSGI